MIKVNRVHYTLPQLPKHKPITVQKNVIVNIQESFQDILAQIMLKTKKS
ncbi:hypothetical protein SMD22_01340 (plasmid) [Brevibacillus halotolerans]|nr:hypothetical protein SMD22_01340 [Brevibacillus halotolerans]